MTEAAKRFPIMPKVRKCKVSQLLAAIMLVGALDFFAIASTAETDTFRVATYNVENYLDAPTQTRRVKPDLAKAKVRECILALHPDVLALQEIGTVSALAELRSSLKTGGLDFPYWEYVSGYDTNVHVAVLSRFPFFNVHPHTNDSFLLDGRRFRVSRGFGEVGVQVRSNYLFTLIVTHLKSKRPIPQADEADLRLEEAKVLRTKINAVLNANPSANLVVLGDLNDNKNAPSTKEVIGRGKFKLLDTRPAERNGDDRGAGASAAGPRNIAWTHYYNVEDTYSRLDYILLSPGMAREWMPKETYVLAEPNWGLGSDHRPVVATFIAENR
jgi:endonuclease/exonuclease/phosphatase family metal-dependent hydrolase